MTICSDWKGLGDPGRDPAACGVGAVVNLEGNPSSSIVRDGLELLRHLDHRGAHGAEEGTGDGAGMLLAKPHAFFANLVADLPEAVEYAVAQLFMPRDASLAAALRGLIEHAATERHFVVIAWREVPTDPSRLGATARDSAPRVEQAFLAPVLPRPIPQLDADLYLLRRIIERRAARQLGLDPTQFYVCSLDRSTIVYKGLLTSEQLASFFPDLLDPRIASPFAIVHSRFSTNTLGAWYLAHPCRRLVHNGEFNSLRGNENWMRAREADLASDLFGRDIDLLRPVIAPGMSDSAKFDNVLELLMVSGRTLPEAMRMMIPEAWEHDAHLTQARRDFYDFHSTLMEPWDGPALVVATDGKRIAAILDRNGFRPCRFSITRDRRFVLASEAGVLDIDDADVTGKGRLGPGELVVIEPATGRVLRDDEVFSHLADPAFGRWLHDHRLKLPQFDPAPLMARVTDRSLARRDLVRDQRVFGYSRESLEYILTPMAEDGRDPIGAMGSDTPVEALSRQPQTLHGYFRQLFAQVSNPPLDYLREAIVTSLRSHIGRKRNLLERSPLHGHQVLIESPILTQWGFEALQGMDAKGIRATTIDSTFGPRQSLDQALEALQNAAQSAIADGHDIVVISDRHTSLDRLPIPSLLAVGTVHQGLVSQGLRTRAALVLDAGEPMSVHQFCCLLGFGADAVHPWLAYASLTALVEQGGIGLRLDLAHRRYHAAVENGLLKVMSKMGISTLEGYKGAQVFEAIGLDERLVARCFTGTPVHLPGIGLDEIESGVRAAHAAAFTTSSISDVRLPAGGQYYWRRDGEQHEWHPSTIARLQQAARNGDHDAYRAFADAIESLEQHGHTIRGLMEFDHRPADAITLDEVEPVSSILRRFATGSMSFGALSLETHEALAVAMNRLGGVSGSGEGGEQIDRFGTERSCSMKQVASGRFGVTLRYLMAAREIEIKMAQGSKPGEGGELPGGKVDREIARVRFSTPGVGLISPPPHHDIYSIEDLAQLIFDLKCANPAADIHVKLVAAAGVGTIAAGVAKARADAVLISGSSGGTGASIKSSIRHAGGPWELGLAEAHQILLANRLRSRIRVRVDGGLKIGRDVVVAALLGAEEFGFGTAALVALGCIMLRKCHCNTCSVGIATQDPRLRARFSGSPAHVVNYLTCVAEDVREHMAMLGFRTVDEMIGRVDKLKAAPSRYDLSRLLYRPASPDTPHRVRPQRHGLEHQRERSLLGRVETALDEGRALDVDVPVTNRDRAFGTLTSQRVLSLAPERSLPADTITYRCRGHAGQSFGAFLASGVSLFLEGDTNDYLGKGLSGGRIAVYGPEDAGFDSARSVICGNVALYGATAGEVYVAGLAGERFAVRNSGAYAVVEGVGDHCCEYMTGGAVAVLGRVGRNFAAGMSGGRAYVQTTALDQDLPSGEFTVRRVASEGGANLLHRLLENHRACTGSRLAGRLLARWPDSSRDFLVVSPTAYERALAGAPDQRDGAPAPMPVRIVGGG